MLFKIYFFTFERHRETTICDEHRSKKWLGDRNENSAPVTCSRSEGFAAEKYIDSWYAICAVKAPSRRVIGKINKPGYIAVCRKREAVNSARRSLIRCVGRLETFPNEWKLFARDRGSVRRGGFAREGGENLETRSDGRLISRRNVVRRWMIAATSDKSTSRNREIPLVTVH